MTVVVAGDLSGLDVAALADGVARPVGRTTASEVAEGADAPAARAADAARIVLVDRPGSVQSELSVGCAGPDRRVDGGWAPYPVLAFVLGGSPNARVDAVLREEKGYTYGIRSGFRPRRRGGLFLTSGSVRADVDGGVGAAAAGHPRVGTEGFSDERGPRRGRLHRQDRAGALRHRRRRGRRGRGAGARGAHDRRSPPRTSRPCSDLDSDALVSAYRGGSTGEWTVVVVGDANVYADQLRSWAGET